MEHGLWQSHVPRGVPEEGGVLHLPAELGYSAELESIIVAKQLDDLADGESSSALLFWRSTRSED